MRHDELEWSDEEDSSCNRYMPFAKKPPSPETKNLNEDGYTGDVFQMNKPFLSTEEEASISNSNRFFEHKRSYFSGIIKARDVLSSDIETHIKLKKETVLPVEIIPIVPTAISFFFQASFINFIWLECAKLEDFDSNSSDFDGMLRIRNTRQMVQIITTAYPVPSVSFHPAMISNLQENYEEDDYLEFVDWLYELKKYITTKNGFVIRGTNTVTGNASSENSQHPRFVSPNKNLPFLCCTHQCCRTQQHCITAVCSDETQRPKPETSAVEKDDQDEEEDEDEKNVHVLLKSKAMLFRVEVLYNRLKHSLRGKVRVKHAAQALTELRLPCAKLAQQSSDYLVQQELLLNSPQDMLRWLLKLVDAPAHSPTTQTSRLLHSGPRNQRQKKIPHWLCQEFTSSEVLLYEHHFVLTDKDAGGDICGEELLGLFSSLGLSLSSDEAQMLIDEYDTDDSGTLNFVEFLVLVYRIQQGTMSLPGNPALSELVTQMKSQLPIFEAIEALAAHPPRGVTVAHYGGAPDVVLVLHLACEGVYANCAPIDVELTLSPGFPYRTPTILFTSRVISIHVLTLLDGHGRLLLPTRSGGDSNSEDDSDDEWWTAEHSLGQLVERMMTLLKRPDVLTLPNKYLQIAQEWCRLARDTHNIDLLQRLPPHGDDNPVHSNIAMQEITSKESLERIARQFNALEKMHLHLVFLFLTHPAKYQEFVQQAMPRIAPTLLSAHSA